MQKLIFNILAIIFVGTTAYAGLAKINPFMNLNSENPLEKFKVYKILIFNSDIGDEPLFFNDKFRSVVSLLKSNGFSEGSDYELITTDVHEDPNFSAVDVIKAIRDSQRPVFIWASSKASADVLEALLRHENLQSKVKGFISVQGALGGVLKAKGVKRPLSVETNLRAEKMPLIQALRFLVDYIYSFSSESYSESMYSLNPKVRKEYLEAHDQEIRKLSKKVPTLYVSRKGKVRYSTISYSPQLIISPLDLINTSKEELALKLFSHFLSLNRKL